MTTQNLTSEKQDRVAEIEEIFMSLSNSRDPNKMGFAEAYLFAVTVNYHPVSSKLYIKSMGENFQVEESVVDRICELLP
jgi:hypothetical protein